ncbi:MAG: SBBP repeat-containing protein [Chitinophagaceae bacterium]|nr:SBBP repeat-containing protein [Chitinophagaceae bacterium]
MIHQVAAVSYWVMALKISFLQNTLLVAILSGLMRLEATSANETVRQIITDPSGNIYITGYFTSSFDVDPGPGTVTLNASSVHQGYLAKFNTNGNYVWAYTFGGSGNNQGLAIDYYNGFIYFSGFVEGTGISFNDASGSVNLLPKGGLETFIAKYSINGDISFVKLVAGTEMNNH